MPGTLANESHVDVLIIGAGPAGLMCANGLSLAGVNVRIVDQRPDKVPAGQADGIQPRTIEVLQSYGLADRLLREGNQLHMAAFYNPGPSGGITRTGRAPDVTAASARYPFETTLHQGAIESIFLDSMKSRGLFVERPVAPVALEWSQDENQLQDPTSYPVTVALKNLSDETQEPRLERVHAKFVVGADGAHSWVRKTLGFAMEGEQTEFVWGVVDTIPDTDFPDIRNRCAIHSPNGSCMVIPREGDMVRLYIQLTDSQIIEAGRLNKGKINCDQLLQVARKSLKPFRIEFPNPIDWWTLYIIGQRVASKFSMHERIFIAGDACHTHSPKAGQGMNASMNDTHNLIWKLTQVLRGWSHISLLKTYEFERRKYAQDLIAFDKKFSALFSTKAQTDEDPDGVTHEQFLEAFQTFGGFTSGIGIHYAPSDIVNPEGQSAASKLIVGQRLPPQILLRAADCRPFEIQDLIPADTRFKILIFAGNTNDTQQQKRLFTLADQLGGDGGILIKLAGAAYGSVFDIISVSNSSKEDVNYTDLPAIFRTHWSKVFTDAQEVAGLRGGMAYKSYGISKDGAVVIVRPDGYIGKVTGIENVNSINQYFSSFMIMQSAMTLHDS
ncbi:hypothetical protein SISNIDRAFT_452748 [Sistotremastrum niveocremeum HHB9708]|uniref:FAD binding domain-containing protein n=2 Tax=Sistotremastraceae TaxID=3402574 RepID=A0A164W1E9_9AGAM|nr:hypothetical protein SISNIDRAFT_452748 [Sistotremastrum niveocremeum HHB9708]KZT38157.1 hypothetical protein SISSUDRAFT_1047381 [Sistotremastrum suecicum HHB10207 ss-3]